MWHRLPEAITSLAARPLRFGSVSLKTAFSRTPIDGGQFLSDNPIIMSIVQPNNDVAQLQELISKMMKGERDPEAAKSARERMDRMREETRKRIGTVEVAVDFIRELRDR